MQDGRGRFSFIMRKWEMQQLENIFYPVPIILENTNSATPITHLDSNLMNHWRCSYTTLCCVTGLLDLLSMWIR